MTIRLQQRFRRALIVTAMRVPFLLLPLLVACGGVTRQPATPPPSSPTEARPAAMAPHARPSHAAVPLGPPGPLESVELPLLTQAPLIERPEAPNLPPADTADYTGAWSGSWRMRKCLESGGAVGVACRNIGNWEPLRLHLSQTGSAVEGVVDLGFDSCDVSGTVGLDGTLTMNGHRDVATHTLTILHWRSHADDASMVGAFLYSVEPKDERFGVLEVTALLEKVVRKQSDALPPTS